MFGRGSPFGSMFGGDPFFSNPFAQMDRMMNSMLNDTLFGHPLGPHPAGAASYLTSNQQRGRQPIIEEVDDAAGNVTAQDEPIVEEPDDEAAPQDRASQRQRRHSPPRAAYPPAAAQPTMPLDPFSHLFGALAGGVGAGGGSSFVFSSSSYSSMGPGGVTYQASSTTRVGPGGVRETQSLVRDGRIGTESVTISRGLGDGRQRTLVRTRDAITGLEEQLENLQGIHAVEADAFDDQWRRQAERNLPGGGSFGAVTSRLGPTGSGTAGGGAQRPLALPSSTSAAGGGGGVYGAAGLYDGSASARMAQPAAAAVAAGRGGGSNSRRYGGGDAQYVGGAGARTAAAGLAVGSGTRTGSSSRTAAGGNLRVDGGYAAVQPPPQQHSAVSSGRSGYGNGAGYGGGGQARPRNYPQ